MMPINFKTTAEEDGTRSVAVFDPKTMDLVAADEAHPNYAAIVGLCVDSLNGADIDIDEILALFDIPKTIVTKFARLGERVTVRDGKVLFDGDEQSGPIEEQILDFLEAGEDVEPIVNFYHRLKTNPLGNVREGLYSWIAGQRASGNFTITPEGKVIGYKSFQSRPAKLRADEADTMFVSSRPARSGDIVNGVEVPRGEFAEHLPGDLVEMPRSIVLDEPSSMCGVGLHIGTYTYAKGFSGDTVMTVVFDPRDIVSLPDSNSSWKLRVCRYEILEAVDAPLDVPLYSIPSKVDLDLDFGVLGDDYDEDDYDEDDVDLALDSEQDEPETVAGGFKVGDKIAYLGGATATVIDPQIAKDTYGSYFYPDRDVPVCEDNGGLINGWPSRNVTLADDTLADEKLEAGDRFVDSEGDEGVVNHVNPDDTLNVTYDDDSSAPLNIGRNEGLSPRKIHGKGGATSQDAKGNGRNPAQDEKGKFSNGRPGSTRDSGTGRFC